MKILVAIPVYDGKLPIQTVRCLLEEQLLCAANGDEVSFQFLPSCSNPANGRNYLAKQFLDSNCDRLVFLDSDVTFKAGALHKIAHHPVEFVGGAYRYKHEPEEYPVGWLARPELRANEHGLLEVHSLPGGFLSLSRGVFEKLKEAHPDRKYFHLGHEYHAYFALPFSNGQLLGDDSSFCADWQSLGGAIYLDPELFLVHWDYNRPYPGHIGNWLKQRSGLAPKGAA